MRAVLAETYICPAIWACTRAREPASEQGSEVAGEEMLHIIASRRCVSKDKRADVRAAALSGFTMSA